ncbi:MAG: hypothetical protein R3B70_31640 [Polyangiaceae bacterium]
MRARALVLAIGFLGAVSAGCFDILGDKELFPDAVAGAGGTGATSATGGTGGVGGTAGAGGASTTSSSTTSTSTATPLECTMSAECEDSNPCTEGQCESGFCAYYRAPDGTAVPDDDLLDCKKPVCQGGQVTFVADAVNPPDVDPNDCTQTYCDGIDPVTIDDNEGKKCGVQPADSCKSNVCMTGICKQVTVPDGTVIDPGDTNIPANDNTKDCRDLVCVGGTLTAVPNFYNCNDPDTTNCTVPTCDGAGLCKSGGGAMQAPVGYDCGGGKKCNAAGQCL